METWTKTIFDNKLASGEKGVLFLTTPLCGTCQVAEQMLTFSTQRIPSLSFGKLDLNYDAHLAEQIEIESVPCLLFFRNGEITKKMYAFHSVQHVYVELLSFSSED